MRPVDALEGFFQGSERGRIIKRAGREDDPVGELRPELGEIGTGFFRQSFFVFRAKIVIGPGTAGETDDGDIRTGGFHLGQAERERERACDGPGRRLRRRGRSRRARRPSVLGNPSRKGFVSGERIGAGHCMISTVALSRSEPSQSRHYGELSRPAATSTSQFAISMATERVSDRGQPGCREQRSCPACEQGKEPVRDLECDHERDQAAEPVVVP